MQKLHCTICGLNGHENAYCWLNGQVYSSCRKKGPEYQEANILWREALKTRQQVKYEKIRAKAKKKTILAQSQARIGPKLYRASKNADKAKKRIRLMT